MITDIPTIKISELNQASSSNPSDRFPVVQSGETKSIEPGLLSTDWKPLGVTPTVISSAGQKEHVIRFANVDYTGVIPIGGKMRTTRTGTVPTKSFQITSSASQYASRPSASVTGLTFTDDFTCEAMIWIDAYSETVSQTIISRFGAQGWIFRLTSSGQVNIYGSNGTAKEYNSFQSVPTGKWVHIAAKMDMSANTATIWFDGEVVPGYFNGAGTALNQTGQDLQLGRFASTDYGNFKFNQVRVWAGLRTDTEIRDNIGLETPLTTTNLVANFKGNDSWNDSSVNLNHLTAFNGALKDVVSHPFNTFEYMIPMKTVLTGGIHTDVTVFTGNGFLPNATLGATSVATVSNPIGFPADSNHWRISTVLKTNWSTAATTSFVPAFAAGFATGGYAMAVPTGKWTVGQQGSSYLFASGQDVSFLLSPIVVTGMGLVAASKISQLNVRGIAYGGTGASSAYVTQPATLPAKTVYRMYSLGNSTSSGIDGSVGFAELFAECAYIK